MQFKSAGLECDVFWLAKRFIDANCAACSKAPCSSETEANGGRSSCRRDPLAGPALRT